LIICLDSCGKKLPPPSPDIFPAKLVSGYYIPNQQIKIDFNEELGSSFDSAFCTVDSLRNKIDGYTKSKSVFLNYEFEGKTDRIDLFGISDSKKNKKDYLGIIIMGEVQKDTTPPEIIKRILSDSIVLLEFSEEIQECSLKIYPEYVQYDLSILKNKVLAKYSDTLGYYPLQFFVFYVADKKGNNIKNPLEYRFADLNDSLSFVSLSLDSLNPKIDLTLTDSDGTIIFRKMANDRGSVLFDNLKQGRYVVEGAGYFKDTLILK